MKRQNTITVENTTIEGSITPVVNVEILATNEVHLKAGTEINAGSNLNVHIGIAQVFNDCVSDSVPLSHNRIAKTEEPKKQKPLKTNLTNVAQKKTEVSYLEPQILSVNVLPNPATEKITVNTYYDNSKTEISRIVIVNTLGQTVYDNVINSSNAQINVSNLINGVYIVKCTDNNNNTSFYNFIKQ